MLTTSVRVLGQVARVVRGAKASVQRALAAEARTSKWVPGVRRTRVNEPLLRPVNGERFLQGALDDIRARVARGEKVRAVFDIDDTLSESRVRTLRIAQAWDEANGTTHFSKLSLEQVTSDGAGTARAAGLSEAHTAAFHRHWDVEFWKPESFVHDAPIPEMVRAAREARLAGAEVVYLTGRVRSLQEATITQLRRFGLRNINSRTVVTKKDLTVRTGAFKRDWFRRSERSGYHLAFFVTESRRDIAAVQRGLRGLPAVLLRSVFEGADSVAPGTPVYLRRGWR